MDYKVKHSTNPNVNGQPHILIYSFKHYNMPIMQRLATLDTSAEGA